MADKPKKNGTAGAPTEGVQQGFGGASQWQVTEDLALMPEVSEMPGMQFIPMEDLDKPGQIVGQKLGALEDSVNRLAQANASMLKGEIPADVSASVRRAASESSMAGGLFGAGARNLSARDLGKTSLDIKQQGIANEQAIVEARSGIATAYEDIRQFNSTRNSQIAELTINAKKQNLDAIDVERQRIATNISANVEIMKTIGDLVSSQQTVAANLAGDDIDTTNTISAFDNIINQLSSKLS